MSQDLFLPVTEIVDVRTAIRRHIVERLRAQTTVADAKRIRSSQFIWLDGEALRAGGPIILVYLGGERIDRENPYSVAPQRSPCFLDLAVEIVASSDLSDVQDALDAIALAVRSVVLRDETQGGHCLDTELVSVTPFQGTADGAHPFASLRLEFECEYEFGAAGDDLVGDLFQSIHVQWDLGPEPDEQIEAEDEIDLGVEED